jgi:hypothetical protein
MSENGIQATQTRTNEAFDRPISLIDATRPAGSDTTGESRRTSQSPSWRQLAKRPTKNSVREGLAKWKYSKYQQGRYASASDLDRAGEEGAPGPSESRTESPQRQPQEGVDHGYTDTSDFAHRQESQERGRRRLKKTMAGAPRTKAEKQPYEIDVLYENQRGWFFFGIPLYSHSSLLNFDPSPWITKDGKDSAVNITNAQLPDPSWEWVWKTWYVDMSYDVDEEGWQYSFSFSRKFSWHGTHPWFHCFVRRRRWLRKRVKKQEMRMKDASGMGGAHTLTSDYFTIHSKRGRSPGSGLENTTTRGSSHVSRRTAEEVILPPEDIKDIPSLLRALRLATIDREKIDAVKRFVDTGGEELVYLEKNIPDIMGFLVFQASRRQLLEYLNNKTAELSSSQPTGKDERKHVENLRNAIRAADSQIGALEYWSDRQHVLRTTDGNDLGRKAEFSEGSTVSVAKDNNPVDVIKGIAGEAEVGVDPTKAAVSPPPDSRVRPSQVDDAAEESKSRDENVNKTDEHQKKPDDDTETPPRLPPDSLKVDDPVL